MRWSLFAVADLASGSGIVKDCYNKGRTYVHVQCLPVSSLPAHGRCHYDQLVFSNEVPYTSFLLCALSAWMRLYIEFEGGGEGKRKS